MRYRIEITEPAESNIEEAYDWIAADSEQAASRWIDGLLEQIETLSDMPDRCTVAPESEDHDVVIRQLFYSRYRILFYVREPMVFILHIRHASRAWPSIQISASGRVRIHPATSTFETYRR